MRAYEVLANLRDLCRFIGLAVNTRYLSNEEAAAEIQRAETEFKLPACDVYRTGTDKLIEACVAIQKELAAQ